MATVLCTGTERVLMETRALILRKSGHTVVTTMNEKELIEACSGHSFDVAVIGQGISRVQKKRVYDLLQQCCPAVKILELYSPTKGRALEQADSWLEVPAEVPDDLAAHVERLAASGRRAKSE